jgi:hypothetical protein
MVIAWTYLRSSMCTSAKRRRAVVRVSAEVDVAATDSHDPKPTMPRARRVGAITAAALALPGVAGDVAAQVAPLEESVIAIKTGYYEDRQPGLKRIRAISPSLYLAMPFASVWSFEGTVSHDDVSGASPRWHSAISGASRMADSRTAGTAELTRSFERSAIALGVAHSDEQDYRSRAVSLEARVASEDNNRTWSLAFAHTDDAIFPTNQIVRNEARRTDEIGASVTQNWTRYDVVQASISHSRGRGYFSDPYKILDRRPRERDQTTVSLRWNHFFPASGDSMRLAVRYYRDTFGVDAYTADVAYAKPLSDRLTVTPSLRYHSQSAADFYYDPVYNPRIGEPFPLGNPRFASPDHRLSAFGAITLGARVDWQINTQWSADAKLEFYEQRSSWRLGGGGSPGLAPLRATIAQIGISRKF